MSRFIIKLSEPGDGSELLMLLRGISMDGAVRLVHLRDPDFFRSIEVEGENVQVVLGRDLKEEKIIGFGIRAVRRLFVNGAETPVGYLSNLRLLPEYRNRTMLARGFKFFRDLHNDGRVSIYLTSIVEDNLTALETLTSGKAGLPKYNDFGRFNTKMIGLRKKKPCKITGIDVRRGEKKSLEKICNFLYNTGRAKQFFPVYCPEDFLNDFGLLRGLSETDLFFAEKKGELLGVAAFWDQTLFKQTQVSGYSNMMKIFRVPWNVLSFICDRPPLPRPGNPLHYFYAGLIAVKDNNEEIFSVLLERLREEGRARGFHFMTCGLHEKDSLNSVLDKYSGFKLCTRIFIVHFDDGAGVFNQIDDRVPYLEVGTL